MSPPAVEAGGLLARPEFPPRQELGGPQPCVPRGVCFHGRSPASPPVCLLRRRGSRASCRPRGGAGGDTVTKTHRLPPGGAAWGSRDRPGHRSCPGRLQFGATTLFCEQALRAGALLRHLPRAPKPHGGPHGATGARGARPSLADQGDGDPLRVNICWCCRARDCCHSFRDGPLSLPAS